MCSSDLPLLFSGFSGCESFYHKVSLGGEIPRGTSMHFVNRASQNLYIKFECLNEDKHESETLVDFKTSPRGEGIIYSLEPLLFNSCYFISLYQKRGDSYCLIRKDKLGDLFNMHLAKGYKDGLFVFTPKGYDMISLESFERKKEKKNYDELPKDNNLCGKRYKLLSIEKIEKKERQNDK